MIRSIATVLNGNIIAQLISLAALPVISKLFTDAAFGGYQLYFAILTTLLPFAAFRLEFTLLKLTGAPRDLTRALALCLGINFTGAILLWLAIGVAFIAMGAALDDLPFPVWLLPVGFVAVGALQTFSTLPVRENAFSLLAKARVLQSLLFNVAAIGMGLLIAVPATLLVSDFGSRFSSSFLIFRKSNLARLGRLNRTDFQWMLDLVKRYRHYPLYSVPSGFLSGISMSLPVMALSALFSISEVGQFAMAWRVTLLPLGVLAFSISQVVNGRIAVLKRETSEPIRPLILRIALFMFGLGLVGAGIVVFLGEPAAILVLGEDWRLAGLLIATFAPLVVSTLTVAPLNTALVLLGHQRAQMVWDIARLSALIGVFLWSGYESIDLVTTICVYSWTTVAFGTMYLVALLTLCDQPQPPVDEPR